ncbi:hypothetical protein DM01DRAFT_1395165 [Hesseltinella vesiculosa]|uniref:Uncharacterized protein n=1 Tax=Hesseltinella vesiculosa TaxID=101127 RepID=A0A1X2GTU1_9FUNG|nr:hypothetical protein DM01DRAFT_1395165 [Hesseltinella vesiculosa]
MTALPSATFNGTGHANTSRSLQLYAEEYRVMDKIHAELKHASKTLYWHGHGLGQLMCLTYPLLLMLVFVPAAWPLIQLIRNLSVPFWLLVALQLHCLHVLSWVALLGLPLHFLIWYSPQGSFHELYQLMNHHRSHMLDSLGPTLTGSEAGPAWQPPTSQTSISSTPARLGHLKAPAMTDDLFGRTMALNYPTMKSRARWIPLLCKTKALVDGYMDLLLPYHMALITMEVCSFLALLTLTDKTQSLSLVEIAQVTHLSTMHTCLSTLSFGLYLMVRVRQRNGPNCFSNALSALPDQPSRSLRQCSPRLAYPPIRNISAPDLYHPPLDLRSASARHNHGEGPSSCPSSDGLGQPNLTQANDKTSKCVPSPDPPSPKQHLSTIVEMEESGLTIVKQE